MQTSMRMQRRAAFSSGARSGPAPVQRPALRAPLAAAPLLQPRRSAGGVSSALSGAGAAGGEDPYVVRAGPVLLLVLPVLSVFVCRVEQGGQNAVRAAARACMHIASAALCPQVRAPPPHSATIYQTQTSPKTGPRHPAGRRLQRDQPRVHAEEVPRARQRRRDGAHRGGAHGAHDGLALGAPQGRVRRQGRAVRRPRAAVPVAPEALGRDAQGDRRRRHHAGHDDGVRAAGAQHVQGHRM